MPVSQHRTRDQVAEIFGVSLTTVNVWIRKRQITTTKIGRNVMISDEQILEAIFDHQRLSVAAQQREREFKRSGVRSPVMLFSSPDIVEMMGRLERLMVWHIREALGREIKLPLAA